MRVAVITGAGRGIGRALALGFAEAGYRVVAADVDSAERADMRDPVVSTHVDVAEPESVSELIAFTVRTFGGVDVMVNNAGIFPRSTVLDLDLATWTRTLDVNLRGTFLGSQAAARVMVGQGRGGRIVNVSSVSAFERGLRQAHYAASKAGIVAFSRNLALELAPFQITVNVLAPGLVDTRQPRQDDQATEASLAARGAAIPLGHMGDPAEMVPAVLFLCSDGASYLTGQTLHVNGGMWMA